MLDNAVLGFSIDKSCEGCALYIVLLYWKVPLQLVWGFSVNTLHKVDNGNDAIVLCIFPDGCGF